ncbi:glycosyl hydrolase [Amorphus orientalis]|uniref:glucan endo-1,3-beta-D-glucosidase n=1 Tax=Amorphus orientalis TaxID=649198 RepID=A0AAE4AR37_9HYPH|nr:glycosyl hydrolase [Amorphus orientalis]MDQ0314756.1 endoglucanase Acf2 [Amorphus orientalis]
MNHLGEPLSPMIADGFSGPVTTNDWASSIAFSAFGDPHSAIMHAHPLSMKATANGLSIGHTEQARLVADGAKYEFTYQPELKIGLAGLDAANTELVDAGAWSATAGWDDGSDGLEATFGHGLPFVYFERTPGSGDAVVNLGDITPDPDAPSNPLVYEISGLDGAYDGGALDFQLPVDAGTSIADSARLKVSYDFNGDGTVDRTELYDYLPTDAGNGFELYRADQGQSSATGAFQEFQNGSVKLELWNSIGDGTLALRTDTPADDPLASYVDLPFDGTAGARLYVRDGASAGGPAGALSPLPGSAPATDDTAVPEGLADWDIPATLWHLDGNVAALTIGGTSYGLFAPTGSTWIVTDEGLRSDLGGGAHFSVATLPDNSPETLELFRQHAYAHVTDTTMSYSVDPATGMVTTRFVAETDLVDGAPGLSADPLLALYRHQYINSNADVSQTLTYASPRGEMRLLEGDGFDTEMQARPILPTLPVADPNDAQLAARVQDAADDLAARPIKVPALDTYWAGKELGRLAELAEIAHQIGDTQSRDLFLETMKAELEDWFTPTGAYEDKHFAYNAEWGTLQGYPASFGSDGQLNDHHFHYGYFVQAAATIAAFDPAWAADDAWGGMVDLLIADVANSDAAQTMFPDLRSFDPYAGHNWASGHGAFASGNNQESSSEALNFAWATARWGQATGKQDTADLGVFLHTVESEAVAQYWFDVDGEVFPDDYGFGAVGMVWGDGADHRTFFSADPEMIRGINFLPINGSSLHLGWDPEEILRNYNEIVELRGGEPIYWSDLIHQYLAMADPDAAQAWLNANPGFQSEGGDSAAHAQAWIQSLGALGTPDAGVTANSPYAAAFTSDAGTSYVINNASASEQTVTFSDGTVLTVGANTLLTRHADGTQSAVVFPASDGIDGTGGQDGSGDGSGDGSDGGTGDAGDGGGTGDGTDGGSSDGTGDAAFVLADGVLTFSDKETDVALAGGGSGAVDIPGDSQVFRIEGLTGQFNGGATSFALDVDAGSSIGDSVQVQFRYDFNGDGTVDRVETVSYFATNDTPGVERYSSSGSAISAEGAFADFQNGAVEVEIWKPFGAGAVTIDTETARIALPFDALTTTGGSGSDGGGGSDPGGDTGTDGGDGGTDGGSGPDVGTDGWSLSGNRLVLDAAGPVTIAAAAQHSVGTPEAPTTWVIDDLTGTSTGAATSFNLPIDAETGVGNATELRISMDYDGDGTVDRVETYNYFPTDAASGTETYAEDRGLFSATGDVGDFDGGSVTVEIWNAFGSDDVILDPADAFIDLGYDFGAEPVSDPGTEPGGDTGEEDSGGDGGTTPTASGTLYLTETGDLSGSADATAESLAIGAAGSAPLVFEADGLNGTHQAGSSMVFDFPIDARSAIGNGTAARISFDFDGDGTADRVETYNYKATDDLVGNESYTEQAGLWSVAGADYADFTDGSVTVEVWNQIGSAETWLDLDNGDGLGAALTLPYDFI